MYHSLMLLAGMLVLFYSPSLPDIAEIIILAVSSLLLYRSKFRQMHFLASFLLAYSWAGAYASYHQTGNLPNVLVNQTALLSACIIRVKKHSANYQRVVAKVSKASVQGKEVTFKGKVSLSYYSAEKMQNKIGWCGEIFAKLKPVHGRLNRRGFDYEAWAYVEKIKALGTIKKQFDFEPSERMYHRFLQFKSTLVEELTLKLGHSKSFELVISLALGERDLISNEVWTVLRQTGTSHLLAISGLHIGFVFWMMSKISTLIWRYLGGLSLFISAQKMGWLSGLAFSLGYLLLAGLPLSGCRAWVMLVCCVCIRLFDKRVEFNYSLLVALWGILLVWPSSVLAIGFWFSFIAVALILSQFSHIKLRLRSTSKRLAYRQVNKFKELAKIQCLLSLAIIPLNVIYFGEISLISPLANLIAVPLVTLFILPLILIGILLHLLGFADASELLHLYSVDFLDRLLDGLIVLNQVKGSVTMPVVSHLYSWCLILMAIFVYRHYRLWPGRWLLCLLFVPLVMAPESKFKPGEFAVTVFDVGQGLALWLKSSNHNILIDTGFGTENGFNHFDATIYPAFKAAGVNKIDALILSHGDADHAGGLSALLQSDLQIGQIYSSRKLAQSVGVYCDHRLTWQWDDIRFRFLTTDKVTGINNQSCVLSIRSPLGSVLFPGDIERESELKLVRQYKNSLAAQVLIVPHHGSSSSSSAHFIHEVNPQLAIFSAGYLNRYGHPNKKIVRRYTNASVELLNTACQGQIRLLIDESGLTYESLRQKRPPFWRHQCQAPLL